MNEVRFLGPVEVRVDGEALEVGASRPARLLVALFVADRRRLDLDALVERCWDDDERPGDPVQAVRTTIRRLRRLLDDDAVQTRPGGYELDLTGLDVDVQRFGELIEAGRAASDPVAAVTSFSKALDLWRGPPFGELGELNWLTPERIRLEESHLLALEGWHEAHLRNGTATEIIPSLESATVEHPMRERFHRQLMQALYLADRQADALRAFQTYRAAMAEAGLEPGPETVALEQRIAQGDQSLKAATQGRPLRGYRIVERLGEGAFSIVYRGTQPSVDRDVAIKQIRAELANRPDFIRRFEAEAHMVAHLEHPFVVPLYDYWREPGSAYLVMRLLPGGSLESSLLDGRWDVDRTARMMSQVGSALAVAHRSGIVHRDVKSANILLDDDGNSYLTDFGIALTESELVDPESSLSAGSPAYASPEQLRREPVGPSADVHGLAIAVYEALTGRLPFPDESNQAALLRRQLHDPIPPVRSVRTDVPVAIDDVLQHATAKAAADRFQTVDEFVAAFEAALGSPSSPSPGFGAATVVPTEDRNPYKGLRAFDEADAADFAGRERLVDQLVAELTTHRFLAVVGPSGSGKSSAVRAGLLPALRRGAVPGSADWFVTTVLPGAHPDEELEAALLRIAAERPPGLIDVLRDGDRGISRALRQVLPEGGQLLLVIDQFEELFTLCDDEAGRRRFLDGLAAALAEERSRLHVIVTLRADFYDRPLRYEAIGRLVRNATVPVLPLAADELERAIVDPARSVGAEYEPGLVSEIVADVADQPGALPLLQYALTELYDRRVSNLLTRDAYHSIGGVTGALASRAEELYSTVTDAEREQLRRLFGRLVTLGEGTEDTRRRVARSELGEAGSIDDLVDRFGRARLLSFDRDPVTREPTAEVAHEALLREWPRLRSWLDEDRDGLRTHRHLTDTSAAWVSAGRDGGELYRGGRLEAATVWATDHGDDLNETEREFLGASVAQRATEQAVEREHAEQQARSNRRLRILVAVATVVAVIAAVAGVVALRERSRARDKAAEAERSAVSAEQNAADANAARATAEQVAFEAETARLVAQSASFAESNPRLAALLSVAAYDRGATPETLGSVQTALIGAAPLLGHIGWGRDDYIDIEYLANERIVAVRADGLDLYDRVTGELLDSYEAGIDISQFQGRVDVVFNRNRVASSTDLPLVAVADRSGSVLAFEVNDSFAELHRWQLDAEPLHVAVDPAGERIAATDADWNLHVWSTDGSQIFVDRRGPRPGTLWEQLEPVFGPDWFLRDFAEGVRPQVGVSFVDEYLFVTDGAYVSLLSAGGERLSGPTLPLLQFAPEVFLVPVSERVIAVDRSLEIYGIDSVYSLPLEEPWPEETPASYLPGFGGGGSDAIIGVMPSDGGTSVVSEKGALFSMAEGAATEIVEAQGLDATSAARAGSEWAIATSEGIVVVSELAASPLAQAFARSADASTATVSRNGELVVAGPSGAPGEPAIWETASGRLIAPDPDVVSSYYAGIPPMLVEEFTLWGFESDGDRVAHVFGTDNGELEFKGTIPDPEGGGGDSRGELTVFMRDLVEVAKLETWEVLVTLPSPIDPSDATFHPTKDWLLASSESAPPVLYDTNTWEPVAGVDLSDVSIALANWSLDGEFVATAAFGESITIRDGETFELIHEMDLPSVDSEKWNDAALIFSADNSLLLANVDGVGRLWDVAAGEPIGRPFPNEGGNSGVNWGELPQLATVNHVALLLWNLDTTSWRDLACTFAGSNLTTSEWEQWGPQDQPFEMLCGRWP
jgi:DNA-binding SARP family transcriptional activator